MLAGLIDMNVRQPSVGAEAAAFLARTTGLDTTHTNAYTALINGLVADGVWTKLDVLHIYATQDSTTALLNLVSTSFNGTLNGSPTFTADQGFLGVEFDSTKSIDTGFNPNTASSPKYTLNSAHLSVWSLTDNGNSQFPDFGAQVSASSAYAVMYAWFVFNNSVEGHVNSDGSDPPFQPNSNGVGHVLGNRSGVIAGTLYKNGSSIAATVNTSTSMPNLTMTALGANVNGTKGKCGHLHAMISIGSSLSSTEAASFYNHLRTYMTAVGVP